MLGISNTVEHGFWLEEGGIAVSSNSLFHTTFYLYQHIFSSFFPGQDEAETPRRPYPSRSRGQWREDDLAQRRGEHVRRVLPLQEGHVRLRRSVGNQWKGLCYRGYP